MDIHRSRFVPYPPSAINALAFSHPEPEHGQQDPESLRLAIGRANGNIEIWNPARGSWLQEKVFYGGKDRSVEGLAWTQEPNSRDAHEWDLTTGLPARHSDGNHSEVWCFAAQPRKNASGACQKLVAGCADGTIVLLSTDDNDLTFERFVSRATNKKARALSIAYKDQHTVLAGFADSMIRVFDTRNGNVIRNISLGSGPHGGPKEILVWKVKCLSNGDFVSGDSTGDIRIYSGKNYSQTQRISGHEADVLDLAVTRDGTSIFGAGMDRRTCFLYEQEGTIPRTERKMAKGVAPEGNNLSVVVTGGIDTQPIVVPIRTFGKELSRGLPALPPTPPLTSAPEARLLVSWWGTEVRIWRVKPQDDGTEKPKVVARLALQGEENIISVSISRDGGLLAVATASTVKLFHLLHLAGAGQALRVRRLEMPSIPGAKTLKLASNGKWLAAITATDEIQLVRVVRTDDPADPPRALEKVQPLFRVDRDVTTQNPLSGPSGAYERSIAHADFSADGNVFAVVDLAGYIDTWVVEGHEDTAAPEIDIDDATPAANDDDGSDDDEEQTSEQITYLGQHWIRNPSGHLLPQLDSTPVLLSFQPSLDASNQPEPNGNPAVHPTRNNPHPHSHELPTTDYRLLLVSAEHQLYLFDVMSSRLSEWSRRNPTSSYPHEYKQLDLPAKGCIWDVTESQQRVWLYGEKWLFMFDLTKDFSISDAEHAGKKRKRDALKNNSGAGDAVPQKEAPVTKMRKFQNDAADNAAKQKWVDVHAVSRKTDAEDDDDMEDTIQPLATLRRANTQDGEQTNGETEEDQVNGGGEVGQVEQSKKNEPWWHTFKYRPILGIVPISADDSFSAPEVVLVERPSWDLDLPPRFVGTHEQ
ncbi:unnamed protein product [Alternaria alternata]